jgi:hypothetical protein
MKANASRQDAEHRLANLVASWVRAREEKAVAVREHNDGIKSLEESIEKLSAEIQGNAFQPSLPFDEPQKAANALDESDPDAQAAKDCSSCGHLRVYHEPGGCIQPDCGCYAFTPGGFTEESAPPELDPTACAHCHHPEGVHGTTRKRGCMRADCNCKGYVREPAKTAPKRSYTSPEDVCMCGDLRSDHYGGAACNACDCTEFRDSDPLGVAHVEPEKREAEL